MVKVLTEAKGRVRHFLGQRIRLRYTPELDFRYDETSVRASRIESLLAENPPKPQDDDEGGPDGDDEDEA